MVEMIALCCRDSARFQKPVGCAGTMKVAHGGIDFLARTTVKPRTQSVVQRNEDR